MEKRTVMSKKNMALFLVLLLLISSTVSVSAADSLFVCDCSECNEGIDLYGYNASCPSSPNGKHVMSAKQLADVYRGVHPNGTYVFTGYEFQCLYCYLVLVTENPAHLYNRPVWGKYALAGANDSIPSGVPVYTNTIGVKNSHDAFTAGFTYTSARSIMEFELYNMLKVVD